MSGTRTSHSTVSHACKSHYLEMEKDRRRGMHSCLYKETKLYNLSCLVNKVLNKMARSKWLERIEEKLKNIILLNGEKYLLLVWYNLIITTLYNLLSNPKKERE